MEKRPRKDKGVKRVAHSGHDRIFTFKFNAMLEPDIIATMDKLIAQNGSIKGAMRFLLTGEDVPIQVNTLGIDDKLSYIIQALENLRVNGKVSSKQKSTVVDAVKDYCNSLADFIS